MHIQLCRLIMNLDKCCAISNFIWKKFQTSFVSWCKINLDRKPWRYYLGAWYKDGRLALYRTWDFLDVLDIVHTKTDAHSKTCRISAYYFTPHAWNRVQRRVRGQLVLTVRISWCTSGTGRICIYEVIVVRMYSVHSFLLLPTFLLWGHLSAQFRVLLLHGCAVSTTF